VARPRPEAPPERMMVLSLMCILVVVVVALVLIWFVLVSLDSQVEKR
jgi:hypothetical protein